MKSLPNSGPSPGLAWLTCGVLVCAAGCERQQPAATAEPAATSQAPPAAAVPAATTDATGEIPTGMLRAYVWHCADGQKLVLRNLFRERAVAIDFHDGTRRLDQTVSASGARYADAVVVFWTKGGTALLEREGAPAVNCEERRAESLREDARARGVAYRAVGNEPGWVLEVGPGTLLNWTTQYGEQAYAFDQALQSTAADGTLAFVARQGTNAIKATVKAERCVDDGEIAYDLAATVEFDGQTYRGCGNRLNPL